MSLNVDCRILHFKSWNEIIDDLTGEDMTDKFHQDTDLLQAGRKGNFEGPNFYHIMIFKESHFWNRVLEEMDLYQKDPRGLFSFNFLYLGKDKPCAQRKILQDALVPHYGVIIISKVKFPLNFSKKEKERFFTVTSRALHAMADKYSCFSQRSNDYFVDNKKFGGQELFTDEAVYLESSAFTTRYEDEKENFNLLYKPVNYKEIGGIEEKIPEFTREYISRFLLDFVKEDLYEYISN